MDEKDFRLLSLLHRDGLMSHAALGRELRVTAQAVAKRMQQLEVRGVLRGFFALPEPEVFRRHGRIFPFRGGKWGEADARAALDAPGVVWVAEKHDGDLTVQVYAEAPDAPPPEQLERALGAQPFAAFSADTPAEWPVLSRLDWRILGALLDDPRQPVGALAERCGAGVKATRRRRERLLQDRLVVVRPLLGPKTGSGLLLFHLGVFSERALRPREIERAAPGAVEVNRLDAPPAVYLFCRARDLPSVVAAQEALQAIEGVREVRLSLDRALHLNRARLRAWVEASAQDPALAGARSDA